MNYKFNLRAYAPNYNNHAIFYGYNQVYFAFSRGLSCVRRKFIHLSYEEKAAMGISGRHKVEKEFDRQIVVKCYMNEIDKISVKE